jgi:elongation factor P hydroxylase
LAVLECDMLKRWQIKYILENLQKEHRLKNIKAVVDKYSNGFTNDKYDPVWTKKQATFHMQTLWDCTRKAREEKKKIYTAGIDVGVEHLYNGRKFKDAYSQLKIKAKEFEKKLKKVEGVSYFKKLEVLLNLDSALYEVHYHYIISTENEVKTEDFENYFEPVYKDAFSTYSYFAKEWITVQSKSFVSKKNLEGKLRWSALPLGKNVFGIVKDFIAKSYDALRKQSIYRYYGDFQTFSKAKGDKQKEARSDYVLQIINLGDVEMLPAEKMGEYQKFKQLEYMREQRKKKKKIEQIKKFTAGRNMDRVEIVIAPPIKPKNSIETDLEMEIILETKEEKKKRKEAEKMARKKARESEFAYQLKLFRSNEEIEREEWKKAREEEKAKAEEWLDTMEDFFDVSEEEVIRERNERIAKLESIRKATTELMLRSEKEYITESKIKAISVNVLNLLRITRLMLRKGFRWLEFALEITKTRYTFSIRLTRTQERNYWRSGKEKVKKVIRPPPLKKVRILLIF